MRRSSHKTRFGDGGLSLIGFDGPVCRSRLLTADVTHCRRRPPLTIRRCPLPRGGFFDGGSLSLKSIDCPTNSRLQSVGSRSLTGIGMRQLPLKSRLGRTNLGVCRKHYFDSVTRKCTAVQALKTSVFSVFVDARNASGSIKKVPVESVVRWRRPHGALAGDLSTSLRLRGANTNARSGPRNPQDLDPTRCFIQRLLASTG
jgi:hypothetical protein